MKLIWHHNIWPWGKTVKIIKSDGCAFVEMSFDDNQPGVCYLSGLSVIESQRRKGIAKHLMLVCESYCREQGIFRIDLNSVLTDWVQDFYKKCGYISLKEENGLVYMYKFISPQEEHLDIDLDREIIKYKVPFTDEREYLNEATLDAIAQHFYKLGCKTKKYE